MSRAIPILIFASLLAAPTALAQDPGCTEAGPCTIVIDLDEQGIGSAGDHDPQWNVTAGDWYVLDIVNLDGEAHTLTYTETDQAWTVAAIDSTTTDPFPFSETGTFFFADEPTGDQAPVTVLASDAVAAEEGEEEGVTDPTDPGDGGDDADNGAPGPSVALLLGLLLLGLYLHRRQ